MRVRRDVLRANTAAVSSPSKLPTGAGAAGRGVSQSGLPKREQVGKRRERCSEKRERERERDFEDPDNAV